MLKGVAEATKGGAAAALADKTSGKARDGTVTHGSDEPEGEGKVNLG